MRTPPAIYTRQNSKSITPSSNKSITLAALSLSLMIASCGGGGGGGSSSPAPATPPSNTGFKYSNGFSFAPELSFDTVVTLDNHFSFAELLGILLLKANGGARVFPCESGQINLSIDDQDASESLTTGDVFTANYSSCRFDSKGIIYAGEISMAITASNYLSDSQYSFDGTFRSTSGLNVMVNDISYFIRGRYQLLITGSSTSYTVQTNTNPGEVLTLSIDGDNEEFTDIVNLTKNANDLTGQYTISGSFNSDSERYQVSYEASFTENYSGDFGNGPTTGTLRLNGPNDSFIDINKSSNAKGVFIADSDGDGSVDTAQSFNWFDYVFGTLFSNSALN